MKKTVVVFGASGKTGQEVVKTALNNDFNVRIIDRDNLFDQKKIDEVIKESNGVIIVFGPRPPYKDIFCEKATKLIVKSMLKNSIKRLICQTGAMIGNYPDNRSFFFQLMSNSFKSSNPEGYFDRVNQEIIIKKSHLDWTIIKPPRLTENNGKLKLKVGVDLKIDLMSSVSINILAQFIIEIINDTKSFGQVVFVKK